MKTCKECGETKELNEFRVISNKCKVCVSAIELKRQRTKRGVVMSIYNTQRGTSKKRGHTPPTYTLEELVQFFRDSPVADKLYREWKLSGYIKGLRPSVDRLDDSYGYSLGNIQLMTWDENRAKSYSDRKSGKNKATLRAVIQMDMDGNFIAEYHSQSEAGRQTGIQHRRISDCCSGKRQNNTGGYQWKYKGKSND